MFMIPFADVYYKAGAIDKANAITERLFNIYTDNLNYYNSLTKEKLINYFETDKQQALGILQRLSMMAKNNQQTELHTKIDSVFTEQLQFYN